MRFKLFNIREDEKPYAYQWGQNNGHEIECTEEDLTLDNVHTLSSFDGVSTQQLFKFDDRIYEALKDVGIKQIAGRAAGFDMFNLAEAAKHDIKITNIPSYSPNAIAEFAVCRALELIRNINKINKKLAHQDFTWDETVIAKELRNMTVLVIGVGRIGKVSARLFKGFGAEVIGYDPYDQSLSDIEYVQSLQEGLSKADLITLHVPANEETTHIINEETINYMKNGAYLVNTARGATVKTIDVIQALNSGKLHSVALDVYENEFAYFSYDYTDKEIEDPALKELMSRDDVLISPHIAFYTHTAVQNMVQISLESALEVITTGYSENEVQLSRV
ncbi:D-2-hydroxyacid dehydrogenase [Mammaliicoccus sciuri]|uniref:D-2-hydroxyacid dehydrogenase n=1 Tax=Mammaliicoccus sciuri TaxID=1296 RepID=UPI00265B84D3|nr:D-2-hydroxyacid dehydrogenase [Mammaliicoccus sciuri]MDO0958167.1 D-2-hydroxyacid dehydrogenase [Mammaliicoccus sciuri]MEB7049981.1 D-2-hydroxyacid dehydrogenase [Mammaliicoccus sciuri]MEB7783080.1 D-2-hydroxyacid dehydrogenase [Mammaliicoccus sciuri]